MCLDEGEEMRVEGRKGKGMRVGLLNQLLNVAILLYK